MENWSLSRLIKALEYANESSNSEKYSFYDDGELTMETIHELLDKLEHRSEPCHLDESDDLYHKYRLDNFVEWKHDHVENMRLMRRRLAEKYQTLPANGIAVFCGKLDGVNGKSLRICIDVVAPNQVNDQFGESFGGDKFVCDELKRWLEVGGDITVEIDQDTGRMLAELMERYE